MSILTSLFTGVSGLNANGAALSVVGDNIANMNTVGFKSSTVSFADIVSASLGGSQGPMQIGRGVAIEGVSPDLAQGSFETTGSGLDLAISGNGFFDVKDQSGAQFYTRDGEFSIDKDGYMVNPKGMRVQGYALDQAGNSTGAIADINLASSSSAPKTTQNITESVNLQSSATIPAAFDVNNPNTTSNYNTALTTYDSLGNPHLVTVYFSKTAEAPTGNTWAWNAVVDGTDTTSGNTEVQASGTLNFNNSGALNSETTTTSSFNFNGGAAQGQAIAFNFGDAIAAGGTGYKGSTQFGSESATVFQGQDGYSSGALNGVSIDANGTVIGSFTNGQTRSLAILTMANFANPQGLTKDGAGLYSASNMSGQPLVGQAGKSGMGSISANSLELSNVDLAAEFVKLIQYQRGFQANSKIITTTDQIMNDVVNLKQ